MCLKKMCSAKLVLLGIIAIISAEVHDKSVTNGIVEKTSNVIPGVSSVSNPIDNADVLRFDTKCGKNVQVINDGLTVVRPKNDTDFTTALTNRPLRSNELLEVNLESLNDGWADNLQIGVTVHSAAEFDQISNVEQVKNDTWTLFYKFIKHNGKIINEDYGKSLDELQRGDRIGVMRKDDGTLHFLINGNDQGVAVQHVPERVYGFIDLYGRVTKASIVNNLN